METVSVIGAGPVGLRAAELLQRQGFEVSVFEEHSTVGRPVQCAGLLSLSGLKDAGISPGESVVNRVKGAKIFSPGGESISVSKGKPVACVVDRFKFDQVFYKKAKKMGCEVRLNSKLIDLRKGNLFFETQGRGEMRKSRLVVGADGANSMVRNSAFGAAPKEKFVQGYQVRAEGAFDRDMVEMHFGGFAPGFFAWVIPESKRVARIGLGARLGENTAKCMERFLEERGLQARQLSKSSALIPIAEPEKRIVSGNSLLVGDAAFQVKATTGGGIVFGLKAAEKCAEAVSEHLKHGQSLNVYMKKLGKLNRELEVHWRLYRYLHGMKPGQLDSLFSKAKKAGIEGFLAEHGDMDKPSKFMRKILFKPSMWRLLPAALKIV